ncbi:Trm112 family protein [bacterium]|nr:Trm112 family protein [bacterium]
MMIKKELLEILACPKCKSRVVYDDSGEFLICEKCRLRYPIEDGIPVMLIEKAVELD